MNKLLLILVLICNFNNVTARESAMDVSKKNETLKMSNSKVCYAPVVTSNDKTKNSASFKSFKACLDAGGKLPAR